MSDTTNTNTTDQGTNTTATDQGTAQATDATPAKMYATRDECETAKPADATKSLKPFEVLQHGTSKGWVLARGYDNALSIIARLDGYSVSTGTKTQPITKEAVAAKLAEFSDDELKALGLTRKKGR